MSIKFLPLALIPLFLMSTFILSTNCLLSTGFEKFKCQQGYSGSLLPEVMDATSVCENKKDIPECFMSCVAKRMGVLEQNKFNAQQMTALLIRQLSGEKGEMNVVRIAMGFNACTRQFNDTISLPCGQQQGLWNCFDRVLDCNASR